MADKRLEEIKTKLKNNWFFYSVIEEAVNDDISWLINQVEKHEKFCEEAQDKTDKDFEVLRKQNEKYKAALEKTVPYLPSYIGDETVCIRKIVEEALK